MKPPRLRFTPTAWAKLLLLRDQGDTEVGGFGIAPSEDLLLVEDVQLVNQQCSSVTVDFDDQGVADFYDRQVDVGLRPEQFSRIWIHTHPADSATPSRTDEDTFQRVFGRSDWSVMFILAKGGETYARLQFTQGPTASVELDVEVDLTLPFNGTDFKAWEAEYDQFVRPDSSELTRPNWWNDEHPLETVPTVWRDAWDSYYGSENEEQLADGEFI